LTFFIYTIFILLGQGVLYIGSLFVPKWKSMLIGRKQTWDNIAKFEFNKPVWVHCASLGEFEQGRSIIELIKQKNPHQQIVLSFFSPSGYEIQKHYKLVDFVFYLPADLPWIQRKLTQCIDPSKFITVKYEFWWNMLSTLIHQNVQVYVISGVFRETDYFWAKWATAFKTILVKFKGIYVQDHISSDILTAHQLKNHKVLGDTRIDRVIARASHHVVDDGIVHILEHKQVIVYGSVWAADMHVVDACIHNFPDFVHVIAPHDVSNGYVDRLFANKSFQYDRYSDGWSSDKQVYILNTIGQLGSTYAYAKYAYIGGGFGKGIHNILEPCAFKIPVFFGPNHHKFNEATQLGLMGGALPINNPSDMVSKIEQLQSVPKEYDEIIKIIDLYLSENKGATEAVYKALGL
jgi:3-deoxy-D-manno-octulosonic-acid transferase